MLQNGIDWRKEGSIIITHYELAIRLTYYTKCGANNSFGMIALIINNSLKLDGWHIIEFERPLCKTGRLFRLTVGECACLLEDSHSIGLPFGEHVHRSVPFEQPYPCTFHRRHDCSLAYNDRTH